MKNLKIGERTGYTVKNANIAGFFVTVNLYDAGTSSAPFDFDKPRLSVKLRQKAFNDIIIDGTIRGLFKGTAGKLERNATDCLNIIRGDGLTQYTFRITFPTVINLNGLDEMYVEVDFPSNSATSHNASSSFMSIKEIDGIGNQFYVPRIMEKVLPAYETEFDHYFGDNVLRLGVISSWDNIPTGVGLLKTEIFSDRRNTTVNLEELLCYQMENVNGTILLVDEEHDQLRVKLSMDGVRNESSSLKVVTTSYYIDSILVTEGKQREAKHLAYAQGKI